MHYFVSENGWMTACTFIDWFQNLFLPSSSTTTKLELKDYFARIIIYKNQPDPAKVNLKHWLAGIGQSLTSEEAMTLWILKLLCTKTSHWRQGSLPYSYLAKTSLQGMIIKHKADCSRLYTYSLWSLLEHQNKYLNIA